MFLLILLLSCLLRPSSVIGQPSIAPDGTNQTLFAGVNICGFDFGWYRHCLLLSTFSDVCPMLLTTFNSNNQGSCNLKGVVPPVRIISSAHNTTLTNNGSAQMRHFVYAHGLNIFRLPVSWQYLTNNTLGGPLNPTNFGYYDQLVQSCLQIGAYCQIELHNYGRWEGTLIGAPNGPSNEQFADIWAQLAEEYAGCETIWFGIMNEPHDMASPDSWAASVQAAVTAIRNTGATTQYISLPGTSFQSAGALMYDGSGAALAQVTNPDSSTTGLVFDVHLYLNPYGNGDTSECITNGISNAWAPLAAWLRAAGRQAIVSETGGGNTASCMNFVCQELDYFK